MSRRASRRQGVTLIEVMLTLAISALLLSTVLVGRNSVRSQAQFIDGMERLKEQILFTKNQANTSNNTGGSGVPTSQRLVLGKTIQFTTTANTSMVSKTLLCQTVSTLLCGTSLDVTDVNIQTTPWQIRYKGYIANGAANPATGDLTLAFARNDQTGAFEGSWYAGKVLPNTQKGVVFANRTPITLYFQSSDGRQATIDVNPDAGTVTRKQL